MSPVNLFQFTSFLVMSPGCFASASTFGRATDMKH